MEEIFIRYRTTGAEIPLSKCTGRPDTFIRDISTTQGPNWEPQSRLDLQSFHLIPTLEWPYKAPKSGICSWSVDLVMYQLHPHKSCDTNAVISLCDLSYTTIHSHSGNHLRYPSDFQNCRQFASSESVRVPQRSKALWILDSAFLYPTLRHRKLTNLAGRNPLVHKFAHFVRWIFQIREPRFSGD